MYSEEEIKKILDTAVSRGGDYADLFVSRIETGSILAEEKKIRRFHRGSDEGAGIRVLKGDASFYYYTNDLSFPSLLALAERAAGSGGDGDVRAAFELKAEEGVKLDHSVDDLEAIGERIRRLDREGWRLSERVHQLSIGYADCRNRVLTASTEGKSIRRDDCRRRFIVRVTAKKENELQTAIETLGDTEAVCGLSDEILFAKLEKAVKRAVKQLDAAEAPSGAMPVVMSSSAGGTMIHEACGHGLEGDAVSKGLSVYKDRLGDRVADERVTVIDDATLKGHYGSFDFDDEGHAGRRNVLIENGVLKQYMYDVRSSRRAGTVSTGNGRRESYRFVPQVRMSNTFIAPGRDDPAAVVADLKKGFFVVKMGGGQVNTINGDFVFEVSEGYLIENGECTRPVKNASLIGNGPKALASVFAVGSDLGFAIGTCGKGGQSVPVGDAQPTLGMTELVIGGKG